MKLPKLLHTRVAGADAAAAADSVGSRQDKEVPVYCDHWPENDARCLSPVVWAQHADRAPGGCLERGCVKKSIPLRTTLSKFKGMDTDREIELPYLASAIIAYFI